MLVYVLLFLIAFPREGLAGPHLDAIRDYGLTTFADLIESTGLMNELLDPPVGVFFGPTNEAFDSLLDQLAVRGSVYESIDDIPGDIMRMIIQYQNGRHFNYSSIFGYSAVSSTVVVDVDGAKYPPTLSSEFVYPQACMTASATIYGEGRFKNAEASAEDPLFLVGNQFLDQNQSVVFRSSEVLICGDCQQKLYDLYMLSSFSGNNTWEPYM